jgi:zinc and cadmium transporter
MYKLKIDVTKTTADEHQEIMIAVFGAIIAYFCLKTIQTLAPFALAVFAASFIYIALTDLIPGLHRKIVFKSSFIQLVLLVSCIAL